MFKVYITDYEGKQEEYLHEYNTWGAAFNYILKAFKFGSIGHSILFTRTNDVAKVFNEKGQHYANFIIKEDK